MPGPEARDRGVIGNPIGRDHAEGNILAATPLDSAAPALADRARAQQQRHHHRRLESGPTPTVAPVAGVEAAEVDLIDRVNNEPGQVILRQPPPQTRRPQQPLVTITRKEVLSHQATSGRRDAHRIVLASPDDKPPADRGFVRQPLTRGFPSRRQRRRLPRVNARESRQRARRRRIRMARAAATPRGATCLQRAHFRGMSTGSGKPAVDCDQSDEKRQQMLVCRDFYGSGGTRTRDPNRDSSA
jgi:hypothetical protein